MSSLFVQPLITVTLSMGSLANISPGTRALAQVDKEKKKGKKPMISIGTLFQNGSATGHHNFPHLDMSFSFKIPSIVSRFFYYYAKTTQD